MGRIIFDCEDREGRLVHFQTSDANFADLLVRYEECVRLLEEKGFTLVKARRRRAAREKIRFDGKHCPACGAPVYDNRERKQRGEYRANAPDFSCSNKQCVGRTTKDGAKQPWAVWPEQYEIVEQD